MIQNLQHKKRYQNTINSMTMTKEAELSQDLSQSLQHHLLKLDYRSAIELNLIVQGSCICHSLNIYRTSFRFNSVFPKQHRMSIRKTLKILFYFSNQTAYYRARTTFSSSSHCFSASDMYFSESPAKQLSLLNLKQNGIVLYCSIILEVY